MGNICRSPSAEGVFRKLAKEANIDSRVEIDSAGTHAYHVGESPDARSVAVAKKRGFDLSGIVSRQVNIDDFDTYDYILAMDWDNLAHLQQMAPKVHKHKIMLLMRYAGDSEEATIGDPYYGVPEGFTKAIDLIEDACTGLLDIVKRRATMYN